MESLPKDLLMEGYEDGSADLETLALLPFKSMVTAVERFTDKKFRLAIYKNFRVSAPRDQRIISYFFHTFFEDELQRDYYWPTPK